MSKRIFWVGLALRKYLMYNNWGTVNGTACLSG